MANGGEFNGLGVHLGNLAHLSTARTRSRWCCPRSAIAVSSTCARSNTPETQVVLRCGAAPSA